LPVWVTLPASAAITFHLVAVIALALEASSGPWLTRFGSSPALGPQFAQVVASVTTNHYLKHLRMTHNYHFNTDRPEAVGVTFEVRLKDAKGDVIRTLKFPEATANPWIRHREALLALALGDDRPLQARPGEVIAAPNRKVDEVSYWDRSKGSTLVLARVPEHKLRDVIDEFREKQKGQPGDGPQLSGPSERSLMFARSYGRYLCRQYGAESAELIRHSRDPVRPELIFMEQIPPTAFATLDSNFGEVRREE
jgi:hypothetical protein